MTEFESRRAVQLAGIELSDFPSWAAVMRAVREPGTIVHTVAPWQYWAYFRMPEYRGVSPKASVHLVDGQGIVLASRVLGRPLSRFSGREVVEHLVAQQLPSESVVVIGGSTKAHEKLRIKCPRWHFIEGRFRPDPGAEDVSEVAERISRTCGGPRVILLALGCPKQEVWADKLAACLPRNSYLCIGGAIDTIGGVVIRPPDLVAKFGLEWLWRLLQQPRRFGPRIVQAFGMMIILLGSAATQRFLPRVRTFFPARRN